MRRKDDLEWAWIMVLNFNILCPQAWPSEEIRQVFSWCTAVTQFIFPFAIISFCYVRVSLKLSSRAKSKPGSKNSKKEELEKERKRRTNRMLIAVRLIIYVDSIITDGSWFSFCLIPCSYSDGGVLWFLMVRCIHLGFLCTETGSVEG